MSFIIQRNNLTGEVTLLGHVPQNQQFTKELLENADPLVLTVVDGVITITASNGVWRYRITRIGADLVDAELMSADEDTSG